MFHPLELALCSNMLDITLSFLGSCLNSKNGVKKKVQDNSFFRVNLTRFGGVVYTPKMELKKRYRITSFLE